MNSSYDKLAISAMIDATVAIKKPPDTLILYREA